MGGDGMLVFLCEVIDELSPGSVSSDQYRSDYSNADVLFPALFSSLLHGVEACTLRET
jgi:hypothetical protein